MLDRAKLYIKWKMRIGDLEQGPIVIIGSYKSRQFAQDLASLRAFGIFLQIGFQSFRVICLECYLQIFRLGMLGLLNNVSIGRTRGGGASTGKADYVFE